MAMLRMSELRVCSLDDPQAGVVCLDGVPSWRSCVEQRCCDQCPQGMQSCAVFDTKAMQQEEGRTAFCLAVFVVVLLIVLSVLFQKDAHKLVIRPIGALVIYRRTALYYIYTVVIRPIGALRQRRLCPLSASTFRLGTADYC
jgi:hypothetical protein